MVLPMPQRPQYSASVRFRTGPCAKLPTDAKVSANTILQWIRLPPRGVIVSGYVH